MWNSRAIGIFFAALALWGVTGISESFAGYSLSQNQTFGLSVEVSGSDGLILLAESKKTKNSTPKPEKKKEEEGFLSKTFNSLIGNDESKAEDKKGDKKKPGEKKEEGFLSKTYKTLVGDEEKDKKKETAKKKSINPLDVAPTVSATENHSKEEDETHNLKADTKKTLKESFDKIIGVDDKGHPTRKATAPDPETKTTQEAKKKDSGGLLDNILGSGEKKEKQQKPAEKKQAKVQEKKKLKPKANLATVKTQKATPSTAKTGDASQAKGAEAEQLEKDRGGTEKGKNVLKESFKTLLKEEKK